MILLDHINGPYGGIRMNGGRYAMRFVWVDDAQNSGR